LYGDIAAANLVRIPTFANNFLENLAGDRFFSFHWNGEDPSADGIIAPPIRIINHLSDILTGCRKVGMDSVGFCHLRT